MIITFCGHRSIFGFEQNLRGQLADALSRIFQNAQCEHESLSFYCGGYGAFDSLAARVIDNVREQFPAVKCEKLFITPYITPSYFQHNEFMRTRYDNIIYPPLETVPYRLAIVKRNEWMVLQSDLIISFVRHSWGGAAHMAEFAKKKNKQIICLSG